MGECREGGGCVEGEGVWRVLRGSYGFQGNGGRISRRDRV